MIFWNKQICCNGYDQIFMETRFEQQEKALQAQSAQIQHSESQAFI